MKCFLVNLDGRLIWPIGNNDANLFQPKGVSSLRYVWAADQGSAVIAAIAKAESDLAERYGWDFSSTPLAEWTVEEIRIAPFIMRFRRRFGFIFSTED